jgi:1-aminocyclopropane-1-carboxylate deaminase/D-cysteine desulfhydrase-like pyridoxal-dependent ACC family enzyme
VLARYPSAELTITPTPIHKLARLSSLLGQSIYIMREDLTGFGIGGNKVRKLDYLVGDAIAHKADTLITTKASNFSRNAAAAGSAFGLDVHVVLAGQESEQNPASQALFHKLRQGRTIYNLHPGGSDEIGSLGYVNAFAEIIQYSLDSGTHFGKIIHSTGSTATQVGLLLGQHLSDYDTTIVGMAASQKAGVQVARIRQLALSTADLLGIEIDAAKIVVEDGFIGPGYAVPSEEGSAAMQLFAATEGILLDDVYTGKAAAGLMHYAREGKFGKNENVLFIHTGGNAGQYY